MLPSLYSVYKSLCLRLFPENVGSNLSYFGLILFWVLLPSGLWKDAVIHTSSSHCSNGLGCVVMYFFICLFVYEMSRILAFSSTREEHRKSPLSCAGSYHPWRWHHMLRPAESLRERKEEESSQVLCYHQKLTSQHGSWSSHFMKVFWKWSIPLCRGRNQRIFPLEPSTCGWEQQASRLGFVFSDALTRHRKLPSKCVHTGGGGGDDGMGQDKCPLSQ